MTSTADRPKLAAIVLTYNVAQHIEPCLQALAFADEILVSDSFSSDGTPELAARAGARVFQREFDNFAGQRNASLAATTADWVFFVDADERVTEQLAHEVMQAIHDPDYAGWWVPRRNFIAGREVRHGGFFPDHQLRVLQRAHARYDPSRPVHEVVLLDGRAGNLENCLIHYNYDDWAQFHEKQRRYAALESVILRGRGVRPWPHKFVRQPWREFRRRYITLQGYKDGWFGLKLAFWLSFYYGFLPHWKLFKFVGRSPAP